MTFAPTPVFYVIVGLMIGMLIGWAMGFFDSNTRTSKKIAAAESNAEIKMKEAERKIAQAGQNPQSSQTQQNDPALLHLKKNDGRFSLELDGALVTGNLSPDQRKRLIELITVFRLWLEPGQSSPVASQPATLTHASSQSVPDPVREAVYGPTQVVFQPVSDPVWEEDFGSAPAVSQPRSPAKKPEVEKNITSMSIVQQIDMVLQARIADTSLAKRGIRLQESIQGGVEVYVGLQKFLAVDDVPDETIKETIRAAIVEWEQKFTPGL